MASTTTITAFIDWQAQLLLTKVDSKKEPDLAAKVALARTARRIAAHLADAYPHINFRVTLRLYHGWHKGYEPTINRKAAKLAIADADFATLSHKPNVVISPDVGWSDRLLHALSKRLHTRLGIHLPNTLRTRYKSEREEEKMVDTALAADIVATAYQDPGEWIMVVTEDDDLVPPVFVAEAALSSQQTKIILLRKRTQVSMLLLDDLLVSD